MGQSEEPPREFMERIEGRARLVCESAAAVILSGGAVVPSVMVLARSRQPGGLVCIPLTSATTSHLFAAADDGPLLSLASALVTGRGAEARTFERVAGLASWGLLVLSQAWVVARYAVSAHDPTASLELQSAQEALVLTFHTPFGSRSVVHPIAAAPRRCALVPFPSAHAPTVLVRHVNAAAAPRVTALH